MKLITPKNKNSRKVLINSLILKKFKERSTKLILQRSFKPTSKWDLKFWNSYSIFLQKWKSKLIKVPNKCETLSMKSWRISTLEMLKNSLTLHLRKTLLTNEELCLILVNYKNLMKIVISIQLMIHISIIKNFSQRMKVASSNKELLSLFITRNMIKSFNLLNKPKNFLKCCKLSKKIRSLLLFSAQLNNSMSLLPLLTYPVEVNQQVYFLIIKFSLPIKSNSLLKGQNLKRIFFIALRVTMS